MGKRSRILPFTSGAEDWCTLLADPEKHWQQGYSARTLAHCWEASEGLPDEVALPFLQSIDLLVDDLQPILAIPEFKVPLPGGARASQNDIFVLAKSKAGPVCIMVEGKVRESFGPRVKDWLVDASPGKKTRLNFLLETLGLNTLPEVGVRYQLFHRAASAIIMAEQFRAVAAVLLVHSFDQELCGWSDYAEFTQLFGVEAVVGTLQKVTDTAKVPLFGLWVVGNPRFLTY